MENSKIYDRVLDYLLGALISLACYSISLIGLMLSFTLYSVGGFIFYYPFYFLNQWPVMLLGFINPEYLESLLGDLTEGFFIGQSINFFGWLIISPLLTFLYKETKKEKQNK